MAKELESFDQFTIMVLAPGCQSILNEQSGFEPHPVYVSFDQPFSCEAIVAYASTKD